MNNYFPTGYQPLMYQPQNNGLIWVQGIEAAKSYLVAPNTTVTLWDSEGDTVYIKSTDANGVPTLRILDYKARDSVSPEYATKNELSELKQLILDLQQKAGVSDEQSL